MSEQAQQLLREALRLSTEERAKLASQLLRSLDDEEGDALSPDEWQRVWTAEIEKRLRDVREGNADLIDGDEVLRELRAGLSSDE